MDLNAAEEFEIHRAFKNNSKNVLNDQLEFKSNQLYDTIVDKRAEDKAVAEFGQCEVR